MKGAGWMTGHVGGWKIAFSGERSSQVCTTVARLRLVAPLRGTEYTLIFSTQGANSNRGAPIKLFAESGALMVGFGLVHSSRLQGAKRRLKKRDQKILSVARFKNKYKHGVEKLKV